MGRGLYYGKLQDMILNCEMSVCGVVKSAVLDIVGETVLALSLSVLWVSAFQQNLGSQQPRDFLLNW